ncbi:MAG: hypothetical protein ACOCQN_00575, partial [Halanaerobiaceae bacterium]
LREARKEVVDILGDENVPAYSTLGDWVNKGFISRKAEGKFRGAKYPDLIVVEIITAIKLEVEYGYKLIDIAEMRKAAGLNKGIKSIDKFKKVLYKYLNQLGEKQSEINSYEVFAYGDDEAEKHIRELEKVLSKIKKIGEKIELLGDYYRVFDATVPSVLSQIISKEINNLSDELSNKT